MTENVMFKDAYHIKQGKVLMYAVDAHQAVARHPKEWSFEPWPKAKGRAVDEAGPGDADASTEAAAESASASSRKKK